MRLLRTVALCLLFAICGADRAAAQTYCVPPKVMTKDPPPPDPPVVCQPKKCDKCTQSPCYVSSGVYTTDAVDLQISTGGFFPLLASRDYHSSRLGDGPLGIGWASSLTPHLYNATYLRAAPNTYSYEIDILMPDGVLYRFSIDGNGNFFAPSGRIDTLIKNADNSYSLTLQYTRSVYKFNPDGSLASQTDDFGNAITYTYDASSRVQRVADAAGSGRTIDVTWGPEGRIASLMDNTGRQVKYYFDTALGTLTGVSDPSVAADPSQRSAYYTYTTGKFGLVLSRIEDRWHRVVSKLDWHSDGKLKSYTDGSYNDADPPSSQGEKYSYTYNAQTATTSKANSLATQAYTYDASGLLVSGGEASYDPAGRATRVADAFGIREYQYDARGNVSSMTLGGTTWSYTYDATFPDNVASVISNAVTKWAGWTYEYAPPGQTAAGALTRVLRLRSDGVTKDQFAVYAYNSRGRVTSWTDDSLNVTTYGYNAAGDLASITRGARTTTYEYDSLGRLTSTTPPYGLKTTYTYDVLDRLSSVTLPKPSPSSPLVFTTSYSYDNYDATTGLVFQNVTDPNGLVTKVGYDVLGHVMQSIDAAGSVTQFTYQYNLLTRIRDANGNETVYAYTPGRELSKTTFPDGAWESYVIGRGALFSKVDRKGQEVRYAYDAFGRVTSVIYPGLTGVGGATVGEFHTYDGQMLTLISDQTLSGTTMWQFTYDSSWRRTVENNLGGEKITYTYWPNSLPGPGIQWAASQIASYKIEPSGSGTTQTVSYAYGTDGRVGTITSSWISSGPFSIDYHPSGGYSRIMYPNGQTRTFAYDAQGRLTNVTNNDTQGVPIASFDYAYDYDWATSTYTMLGQRTSVNVTAVPGTMLELGTTTYRYDALYQLIRADHPGPTFEAWTYDAIGNRLTSRLRGGYTYNYTYYKNGTNPNNGQRLRNDGSGVSDYTYDANGNVTGTSSMPRQTQDVLVWDYANRLTSLGGTTYAYDLGRRKSATTGTSTTRYISLGMHTVGERNTTTGVSNDYLFAPGIDEPLAKRSANGTISYYGADGLGSIALATNDTGAVTGSGTYSPWGEGGIAGQLFGYTGRETGSAAALFYRARYYDPARGRFLSEDPVRSRDNGYAYATNSPVDTTDPSGMVIKRCFRRFLNTKNRVIAEMAIASPLGWLQPPVPGTRWCPMHEYIYNTDTGRSLAYDPGEEAKESGNDICWVMPDPIGQCVWSNFKQVRGPTSDYSKFSHNCQTTINDTVEYCQKHPSRRCVNGASGGR